MKRGIQNENIDYLVLDCTFSEPFWNFPTQSDAIRQIFQLIENNPTADIYLECEMLGTEPIIVCIAKKYNTLVWETFYFPFSQASHLFNHVYQSDPRGSGKVRSNKRIECDHEAFNT